MSLTILNSISSLTAENALSLTQASLQKTLTELSTGLKINSGSDDAAGLSIANGLQANISALTQSSQNASDGIGQLQTADGALSQVTTLLNRAVTLATEASNGGLSGDQSAALNNEFQSILSEITNIGATTNYNGESIFAGNTTTYDSTQGSVGSPLATTTPLTTGAKVTISDSLTGGTFVYTAAAGDKISNLQTAITNAIAAGTLSAGVSASINANGQLAIATTTPNDSLQVSTNDAVLGSFTVAAGSGGQSSIFTSDGTASGSSTLITNVGALSADALGLTSSMDLSSASDAQTALSAVTAAVSAVAANRGTIGAAVNRLTAATGVENTEVTNLTSAQNAVQNADIGQTVAMMTQESVLQQTGMAALSQSNQMQQAVLKLLQ